MWCHPGWCCQGDFWRMLSWLEFLNQLLCTGFMAIYGLSHLWWLSVITLSRAALFTLKTLRYSPSLRLVLCIPALHTQELTHAWNSRKTCATSYTRVERERCAWRCMRSLGRGPDGITLLLNISNVCVFFLIHAFLRSPLVLPRALGCGARKGVVSIPHRKLSPARAPWRVPWAFKVTKACRTQFCVEKGSTCKHLSICDACHYGTRLPCVVKDTYMQAYFHLRVYTWTVILFPSIDKHVQLFLNSNPNPK